MRENKGYNPEDEEASEEQSQAAEETNSNDTADGERFSTENIATPERGSDAELNLDEAARLKQNEGGVLEPSEDRRRENTGESAKQEKGDISQNTKEFANALRAENEDIKATLDLVRREGNDGTPEKLKFLVQNAFDGRNADINIEEEIDRLEGKLRKHEIMISIIEDDKLDDLFNEVAIRLEADKDKPGAAIDEEVEKPDESSEEPEARIEEGVEKPEETPQATPDEKEPNASPDEKKRAVEVATDIEDSIEDDEKNSKSIPKVIAKAVYKTITTIYGVKIVTDLMGAVKGKGTIGDFIKGRRDNTRVMKVLSEMEATVQTRRELRGKVKDTEDGEDKNELEEELKKANSEFRKKADEYKLLINGEKDKDGKPKEEGIEGLRISDKEKSDLQRRLGEVLSARKLEQTELSMERDGDMQDALASHIDTKSKGIEITKDALNFLTVSSGLFVARAGVYGLAALAERGAKKHAELVKGELKGEHQSRVDSRKRARLEDAIAKGGENVESYKTELTKLDQAIADKEPEVNRTREIIKDITVNSAKETFQGITLQGGGSKKQKIIKFVQAAGGLARIYGIAGSAFLASASEASASGAIDELLDSIEDKGIAGTIGKNFKDNAKRINQLFGFGGEEESAITDNTQVEQEASRPPIEESAITDNTQVEQEALQISTEDEPATDSEEIDSGIEKTAETIPDGLEGTSFASNPDETVEEGLRRFYESKGGDVDEQVKKAFSEIPEQARDDMYENIYFDENDNFTSLEKPMVGEADFPIRTETVATETEVPPVAVEPEQEHVGFQDGKHVWGEIEKQIPLREDFAEFAKTADEATMTHLIDQMKDKLVASPEDYGLAEEFDVDVVTKEQLESIDWDELFSEAAEENAIGKTEVLTQAEKDNILDNNKTLKLWAEKHPSESLDSQTVDTLLKDIKDAGGVEQWDLVREYEKATGENVMKGEYGTIVDGIREAGSIDALIEAVNSPDSFAEYWNEQSDEVKKGAQDVLSGKLREIYDQKKFLGIFKRDRIDEEWIKFANQSAEDGISGTWEPALLKGADTTAQENFKQLQTYLVTSKDSIGEPLPDEKIYEYLLRAEAEILSSEVASSSSEAVSEVANEAQPTEAETETPAAEQPASEAVASAPFEETQESKPETDTAPQEATGEESSTAVETPTEQPVADKKTPETKVADEVVEVPQSERIGALDGLFNGAHITFKYNSSGKLIGYEGHYGFATKEEFDAPLNEDYRATMRSVNRESESELKRIKAKVGHILLMDRALEGLEAKGFGASSEAEYLRRSKVDVIRNAEKRYGDIFK